MTYQSEPVPVDDTLALKLTLDRLVRNVGALLGVPSVSVGLLDPETGDIVTWATLADAQGAIRRTRFRPNEGIAGWVAAHLEPAIVQDVSKDDRFKSLGNDRLRSMLCVPLIDQDQLLGTLTAGSDQVNAFDKRRQQLLQIFTDQAVLAISKTRQAESAKAQARELAALLDASRALTSSLDAAQVFSYIVGSIRKVIECEDAVIYYHDEQARVLRVMGGLGLRLKNVNGAVVPLDDDHSMAAWVANQRRARVHAPEASEFGKVTETLTGGEDLSLLCVPLVSKERLQGVIMLARKYPFQAPELGAMLNLSNIVAATLENVQLFQTARAEREQQSALYAAASDAIAVVDDSLQVIEANPAFAEVLDVPADSITGHSICQLLHFHQSACMLCGNSPCTLKRIMESGARQQHLDCVLPAHPADADLLDDSEESVGALRYIDFSLTPVTSGDRQRLLVVGRDVSMYRQFDAMKANFLSLVAHELRGPLQTINGYLDVVLDDSPSAFSEEQLVSFLRRARAGGESLRTLVEDLLLIWRLDAGQFNLHLETVDLTPTIENAVHELELFAEQRDVSLEMDIPETIPLVTADTTRMAQVMRNLLTNAIKFTPERGAVRVIVNVLPDALEIRVCDTGIGIPPEYQRRVFERFFQVKRNPTKYTQGQGLGLSVVQIIATGHGGSVDVESVPGQGSTFIVRIPRQRVIASV